MEKRSECNGNKARIRISCSPFPGGSWHLRSRYMIKIRLPWRHRLVPQPLCMKFRFARKASYPYDGIWAEGFVQELLVVSDLPAMLFGAGAPRSKLRAEVFVELGQWMP